MLTAQEYIQALRQLYLTANAADVARQPWQTGDETWEHCRPLDTIIHTFGSDFAQHFYDTLSEDGPQILEQLAARMHRGADCRVVRDGEW